MDLKKIFDLALRLVIGLSMIYFGFLMLGGPLLVVSQDGSVSYAGILYLTCIIIIPSILLVFHKKIPYGKQIIIGFATLAILFFLYALIKYLR
jgi:hypothetical protein